MCTGQKDHFGHMFVRHTVIFNRNHDVWNKNKPHTNSHERVTQIKIDMKVFSFPMIFDTCIHLNTHTVHPSHFQQNYSTTKHVQKALDDVENSVNQADIFAKIVFHATTLKFISCLHLTLSTLVCDWDIMGCWYKEMSRAMSDTKYQVTRRLHHRYFLCNLYHLLKKFPHN